MVFINCAQGIAVRMRMEVKTELARARLIEEEEPAPRIRNKRHVNLNYFLLTTISLDFPF